MSGGVENPYFATTTAPKTDCRVFPRLHNNINIQIYIMTHLEPIRIFDFGIMYDFFRYDPERLRKNLAIDYHRLMKIVKGLDLSNWDEEHDEHYEYELEVVRY